ncbi:MBL fold metallo-hydrolase [Pseudacidovorax intermedius]|uniref:Glyoxylase-like metal-dependent hydrolase (Beta-lactamase superfamily II) n=1 Tax=Pseudacidovorax intermedius TaxID=433924 RepID=A0A370FFG3_9BURK|nr:MBL fold metallo-hydrolase [Pseudacidovorax intermedius]RDI22835.1 glyoxylase-like metal-dependent hydrolase (beta-lactamase superfamily II) [Pseudacidovorax intermedius]
MTATTAPAPISFASASDTREQKPRLTLLAPDVYGYISDFDPNCGFVVAEDQVVLIDTRPTPRMARDFLAAIRSVTDKPVRTIVLTHYHAVRVMGASAFDEVQAIIASQGTLDWIRTRGQADFDSEVGRFPRLFEGVEEIPGLTRPTVSFDSRMSLWLGGGRELQLLALGRGHSSGDTVAWLPEAGVCFSGDVVENRCGVYAGDAYIRDWAATLDAVAALRPRTLVPGRGAVLQGEAACAEAIRLTQDFLATLLGAVQAGIDAGESLKGCFARAEAAMVPRFGDWPVFRHVLPFDVSRAYDELTGTEHPAVWTAERDRALWQVLHG